MRRAAITLGVVLAVAVVVVLGTGAANKPAHDPTYKIELDNAFGLVSGAAFKVNGVPAGSIGSIDLDQKTLDAVVTIKITTPGVPQFHTSASCDSEPQSLIGEYYITCNPGTTGAALADGATIGVGHTTSTIPADLVLDIMQVPERERLPLIINSLGAGIAARSEDLSTALYRAVPALRDTDQLLALLDDNADTLKQLTTNADHVVTELSDNSAKVQHFIDYANRAASDTAPQAANLKLTLKRLPGFLAELGPDLTQLGEATQANTPVLTTLNRHAAQLKTLFTDLPGFANSSLPAIQALGKASVTGTQALTAAKPVVKQLNTFSTHVPELAQNLAIVLPHLDNPAFATEVNKRAPGGKGYSGLEDLLQFAFNLAAATNYYGPTGHMLGVDGFLSAMCTPYATQSTITSALKQYGSSYRSCYSWLGPNQPGVNEQDPSDPSACVPDPGALPPGQTKTISAPAGTACSASTTSTTAASATRTPATKKHPKPTHATGTAPEPQAGSPSTTSPGQGTSPVSGVVGTITKTLSGVTSTLGGVVSKAPVIGGSGGSSGQSTQTSTNSSLLNYLLGP